LRIYREAQAEIRIPLIAPDKGAWPRLPVPDFQEKAVLYAEATRLLGRFPTGRPSEVGIGQPGVTHDAPLRPGLEVGVAMDRDRGPAAGVGVSIDMMAAGDAGQPPAS